MATWFKFHTDFRDHYKTRNACRALGIDVVQFTGHMVLLWSFTTEHAWKDADLAPWGDEGIEQAAGWKGQPGAFVAALRECGREKDGGRGPGFLDGSIVHDWLELAGKLVTDRIAKIKKRRKPRQEEQPEPAPGTDATDYDGIQAAWNAFARKHGLSEVRTLTRERRAKVRARDWSVERLNEILTASGGPEKQPFLFGSKGWRMDFDWLFAKDDNALKVLEGKYRSATGAKPDDDDPYKDARARQRARHAEAETAYRPGKA